jgi:putative endonuclease
VYYVYMLASRRHGTLYIGVTNDLRARIELHRLGLGSEFVKRYTVHKLVYVEPFENAEDAIRREKQLKKMESRLEDKFDRRRQSGMARFEPFDRLNMLPPGASRRVGAKHEQTINSAASRAHTAQLRISAAAYGSPPSRGRRESGDGRILSVVPGEGSETRDPYSPASQFCCGVWVPAFAGTTAGEAR